jgi:hypothetical protein
MLFRSFSVGSLVVLVLIDLIPLNNEGNDNDKVENGDGDGDSDSNSMLKSKQIVGSERQ